MNKKLKTILAIFLSTGLLTGFSFWFSKDFDGERTPYLQMPAPDAMTFRWQSEQSYQGNVFLGLQHNNKTHTFNEKTPAKKHELHIDTLEPLTQYFYSAGNKTNPKYNAKDYWFVTPPKTGEQTAVRFWVTGDQGKAGKKQDKVKNGAMKWLKNHARPNRAYLDFWLTTGDNAYQSGTDKQFQKHFFEPYKNILKNIAVWPAYGNHDAKSKAFFDIFSFPTNAESGGIASDTENYYAFDYANIHFVFLDSQDSNRNKNGKMAKWLVDDLNANKQTWLIVVFHHPPYSKGTHNSDNPIDSGGRLKEMREEIVPILEHFDADLVLAGHSHVYERSHFMTCHYDESSTLTADMILDKDRFFEKPLAHQPNQGTVYSVIGSSAKKRESPLDHPVMDVAKSKIGSVIIDVVANKLTSRFINKKGKVTDKFEIVKKAGLKTSTPKACN